MVQCIRKMIRGDPEIMSEDFITMTIGKQKNIALIAHDNKKADLIDWCEQNKEILKQHFLCGTGTTARMITDQTGLPVRGYNLSLIHILRKTRLSSTFAGNWERMCGRSAGRRSMRSTN